jgi:hypothetical protein
VSDTRSSRALLEVIVAVVLVAAVAAIGFGVLGWLAGAIWTLVKVVILVGVLYLVIRLLLARR